MTSPLAEGWLFKQGSLGLVPTRQARYCVLTENELRYYKHKEDSRANGIIELKHYLIAEKDSGKHHPYGFRIVSQCKQDRSYLFYADNEKECQYWMGIINNLCLKGLNDPCESAVLPLMDESCTVLDKWLNRLDLNDDPTTQSMTRITSPPPSLIHSPITKTNNTIHSSLVSPISPSRMSSDSLDSLPSETTLSSSTGSRAYMSTTSIDQQLSSKINSNYKPSTPSSPYNKRHSNPITFVSRSLINLKNHHVIKPNNNNNNNNNNNHHHQKHPHPHPHHHQQSPIWPFDNTTFINNNIKAPISFLRKDWETEDLFHFEHDMGPDSPANR